MTALLSLDPDFKPAARPDPDTVIHRDGW